MVKVINITSDIAFWGILQDGKEMAINRLSRSTRQGLKQLTN
jgi:hypothetical protein